MNELDSYLLDLRNLEQNLDSIISAAILKNEGLILQKLKLRLFNIGVDGSGRKLQPDYSKYTITLKKSNNQRTSHVTLRDTGAFYASMYLEYNQVSGSLFVDSDDPKYLELVSKYGPDILGLTIDEQRFIIFSIVEPAVQKELNKINNRQIDLS
jgi:hypothetical protein